ncbi:hypothetical protein niasHT_014908 [Heterodera trifolii]|uniref:Uncharacterized protein n=1 Tax=Heterodera trifolii TaxID=157864 RepID=A0ABD2LFK9_9BILA
MWKIYTHPSILCELATKPERKRLRCLHTAKENSSDNSLTNSAKFDRGRFLRSMEQFANHHGDHIKHDEHLPHGLITGTISKASANQRARRAGRTQDGVCYRLYSELAFANQMLDHTPPEVKKKRPKRG